MPIEISLPSRASLCGPCIWSAGQRNTPTGVTPISVTENPDRDFAALSLSLDHCLPFSPPPLWLPSLLLFIARFLELSSATKGRGMTRKVRIVASCDCSPPRISSARGSSYGTEPLWARRVTGRREGSEGGKAIRSGLPGGCAPAIEPTVPVLL